MLERRELELKVMSQQLQESLEAVKALEFLKKDKECAVASLQEEISSLKKSSTATFDALQLSESNCEKLEEQARMLQERIDFLTSENSKLVAHAQEHITKQSDCQASLSSTQNALERTLAEAALLKAVIEREKLDEGTQTDAPEITAARGLPARPFDWSDESSASSALPMFPSAARAPPGLGKPRTLSRTK